MSKCFVTCSVNINSEHVSIFLAQMEPRSFEVDANETGKVQQLQGKSQKCKKSFR